METRSGGKLVSSHGHVIERAACELLKCTSRARKVEGACGATAVVVCGGCGAARCRAHRGLQNPGERFHAWRAPATYGHTAWMPEVRR